MKRAGVLVWVMVVMVVAVARGAVAERSEAEAEAETETTLRSEIQARLRGWVDATGAAGADKPKKTTAVTDVVQTLFVASEPVVKFYLCPDPLDTKCAVRFRRLPASGSDDDGSATTTAPKFAIFSSGKKPQELVSSMDANGHPQVAWIPKINQAPWGATHANNSWIVTRVSEWVDYAVVGLNVGGHNYVVAVSDPLNDNTHRDLAIVPFYGINFADDNMMATAVWVVDRNL